MSDLEKQNADDARILIVDDDASMRLLLSHALERDGYRLSTAQDGVEALEVFAEHQPDLILLDSVMPALDGLTVCRLIKEMPEGRNVPILIVTGLDDEWSVAQAFDAGAVDFIPKPVNWAVLRQRVRRIIGAKRAEQDIAHLAFHDMLTGLPNRRLLLDRLGAALARADRAGTKLALLFIDLDRFKHVNDSRGHEAGDQLLRVVAERLVASVRESDTVARLGGDEFTVILEGVSLAEHVAGIADNLLNNIARPVTLRGQTFSPRASVGVALYPEDGRDLGTLLKHADTAMYRAKDLGRNRYQFFTAELGAQATRKIVIETSLHEAVAAGELRLVYAPRVDVGTGDLACVECLLRWAHPELGLIAPTDFLPVAETSGQGPAIGEWVMRSACRQLADWRAAGATDLRLAINVSASHLHSHGLAERFRALLNELGLSADLIELELSERIADRMTDAAVNVLHELHALGARVSLDDFGTGHTSLLTLRRLPVTTLKIDHSFVRGLPDDPDCVAIVRAVAAMAGNLGIALVAEGVETAAQLEFIRKLGCRQAEGYLFARPQPAERFALGGRRLAAPALSAG